MPKTPSKMHMYEMVKIDTIVFEIVRGGGWAFKAPPPLDRLQSIELDIKDIHCFVANVVSKPVPIVRFV